MGKSNTFHFAFALLLSCTVVSWAIPKGNYTDEDALLAFKAHVISDPFQIITTNWSSSTPLCHWIGVTCSARHQRVAALDLSYLNLQATIPPHIGNLSFLVSLNLSNNSFYGQLPTELANLQRLKSLDLRNNTLNGIIPSRFGGLPVLEELILGNNGLTGTIPSTLFNISSLIILKLRGNFLRGNIPREIGNHSNLQQLWLGHNFLSGDVPLVLFNMSSLQFISLQSNNFSGALGEDLCNYHPDKLEWLDLSRNQLKHTKLEILDLERNNLVGVIPREVGALPALQELWANTNQLSSIIPEDICSNHSNNLKVFAVAQNQLSGPVLRILSLCRSLEWIHITGNKFNGNIPGEIGNLTELEYLHMGENHFTGAIPREIGHLTKLEILDLQRNNLVGAIPREVGALPALQELWANTNQLSSIIPEDICSNHSNNLKVFVVAQNQLSGPVLPILSLCRSLEWIHITGNKFNGNIPGEIGNLTELEYLDMGENHFTGCVIVASPSLATV